MKLTELQNMNKSPLVLHPGILAKAITKSGTTKGNVYTKSQKNEFIDIADKYGALRAQRETGINRGNYAGFRRQKQAGLLL